MYAVDKEGTEDVFKDAIRRTYQNRDSKRGTEIDVMEDYSIDWKAERECLAVHHTKLAQQHSFIPRIGELVLWFQYFPDEHYLMQDPKDGSHKFYSFHMKEYHGFPDWRCGVVTQVPTSSQGTDSTDFRDILEEAKKSHAFNNAGFRIETLPDPNGWDKSMSKQYQYLSLRHIRPLSHWQFMLQGENEKRWHPSIKYGLTCMTSVSLVEKWRVNGEWPNAIIRCKACYLGSELIMVGDTVRIMPSRKENLKSKTSVKVTDVLVVTSIRLKLLNARDEHVSPDSPYLSSRSLITFVGHAYTLDIRRDYNLPPPGAYSESNQIHSITVPTPVDPETVKFLFRPVNTGDYGALYPLHRPYQRYEVSQDRVLGRLYEADAVRLWTGLSQIATGAPTKPTLSYDLPGILSARTYATATNNRIPDPTPPNHTTWHWTDTRTQSLGLATVNGQAVAQYDDTRDRENLKTWRADLRKIAGAPDVDGEKPTGVRSQGSTRGRKPGAKVVNGKIVYPDDDIAGSDEEPDAIDRLGRRRAGTKVHSQMAGAAYASTDDDALPGETASDMDLDKPREVIDLEQDEHGSESSTNRSGDGASEDRSSGDDDDDQDPQNLLATFGATPTSRYRDGLSNIAAPLRSDNRPETARSHKSTASPSRPSSSSKHASKQARQQPRQSQPLSKAMIMESVEAGDDLHLVDDDGDSDDDLTFLKTVPLARGGTEESEGGDYRDDD